MNQWGQPPAYRNFPPSPEPEKSWFESNKPQVIAIGVAAVLAIGFVVYKTRGAAPVALKKEEPEKKTKVVADPIAPVAKEPVQKSPAEPEVNEPETTDWSAAPDAPADDAPLDVVQFALAGAISPAVQASTFAMAPGGNFIALAGKDQIEVWNLDQKQRTGEVKLAGAKVLAVALPDRDKLIVWSQPGGIESMNAKGEARTKLAIAALPEQKAEPDRGLALSAMGRYFAISRNGTRIYRTDDGTLCGVIPLPTGQSILAQGFHPKGKELYVVYQTTEGPRRFRVAIFDLATGQETKDSHKPRPGALAAPQIRGPLAIQFDDQNRMYVFLAGRAILNGEDGRLLSLVEDPPEFAVPLDQGRFWTGDGKSVPKVTETEWGKLQKLVRNFDTNKGASQVHPEEAVTLKIEVGKVAGDKGLITQKLEAAIKDRLTAEGIAVKSGADTRLEVIYSESEEKLPSIKVRTGGAKPEVRPAEGMAVLPEIEVRWHNAQVERKQLWTRKFKIKASDVICTESQAKESPAAAFAAASRQQALELLSGYPIPYYVSQAIVGGSDILPLQSPKLK